MIFWCLIPLSCFSYSKFFSIYALGAIEKQKLVYILNRDPEARLTISSPLEAHKSNTLVYHMVGVDVGFDNPMFACLEIDYEESDSDPTGDAAMKTQQTLTFYELDLGLNHVVRKYSEPLEEVSFRKSININSCVQYWIIFSMQIFWCRFLVAMMDLVEY